MVPRTVLTRSGPISVNTARLVNTVQSRTTVNNAGPMKNIINNAYSTARRPFNKITAANNNNFTKKVNTVKGTRVNTTRPKAVISAVKGNKGNAIKASACWVWRPKHKVLNHVSRNNGASMSFKRFDYIDAQGRSKHMTGNISYLTDYEEIDGGFVAFGGNSKGWKITGKCKIRTSKLDFEDVYFVKELKFNLFSVSQMCDKKNSVLFTDTESRRNWLFDIDALTKSMNYKPVVVGNQSNGNTSTKACDDAVEEEKKDAKDLGKDSEILSTEESRINQENDMDVKSAFLYVEKALYGLDQAPKAWYEPLSTICSERTKTKIHIDNKSTICIVKNPVFHSNTKHIELRHHFIRDSNEKKLIQMIKIHTDQNVTDLLTKAFDVRKFQYLIAIALLAKPTENEGFEEIVDFLNANPIKYALTVNPTVYCSCIKQLWDTVKAKTVNREVQLQALVDKKNVIITKSTIRRDLQLEDANGVDCMPNATIFEELTRMGRKQRKDTEVSQPSGPTKPMADETENVESVPTHSNDPLLSGDDSIKLNELMELCTTLQKKVLDLETSKTTQALEIDSLKKRVKKLKKKQKSRTHKLRRLYKVGLSAKTTIEVSAATATTTTIDELTLAQTLIEIKAAKPKVRGVMI
ncbi:hypothetical protein Tco_0959331 [Tanacetum coccineum]